MLAVDVNLLHATIGELTLENDFWKDHSPRRGRESQGDDRP